MICASEDVGNADPNALTVAVSAAQAVERLGMPEAQDRAGTGRHLCGERTKEQCGLPGSGQSTFRCQRVETPHRFQRISVMPITKVLAKAWTMVSDINMPTIIRIIMWNSSICRMRTKI